jgi:hypothetical protein
MSNTIQIKRSSTSGSAPTAGQLAQGELAVNLADEALYTKDASNVVVKLNAPSIDDKNTGATKHVTIDTSGNVGIGTSSPAARLHVEGSIIVSELSSNSTTDALELSAGTAFNTNGAAISLRGSASGFNNNGMEFYAGNAERARIDSSGNLLVGTTSAAGNGGVTITTGNIGYIQQSINTATNSNHFLLSNQNATNNGFRFYVSANGGIYNFSGNNVNLSDERTKKNIEVAGGYLDKICAIPVKLFNYKDEAEGEQQTLGVIAQDVEAVAPEFVNNDGWEGAAPEDGSPLKTIYTTDMMFGLMKAIQEQQAIITALAARVEALEAKK